MKRPKGHAGDTPPLPIYIHLVMLKYLELSVNYFGRTFVKYVNRILRPPLEG